MTSPCNQYATSQRSQNLLMATVSLFYERRVPKSEEAFGLIDEHRLLNTSTQDRRNVRSKRQNAKYSCLERKMNTKAK